MRRPYDSLEVPLPEDVRKRVHQALVDDCRRTVQANTGRDYDLFQLRQQLEGVAQPGSDGPQPNGCQLEDSLPFELHTTAHANVCGAFRQKPYATLDALHPDHDEQVARLETLLNSEAQLFGFDQALTTLSYIALEGRYACCCVEYRTSTTKHKELREPEVYDDSLEQSDLLEEEHVSPVEAPQPELWQVTETTEQFEFRSVDPWDFYLSPPGSQKVDRADRCIERVWMSRTALLDGVRNEGFDAEAVKALLKGGPTAVREGLDPRAEQMALQGIVEDTASFYECYKIVGRMPYVMDADGEQIVPEQFLDEDYVWYLCPERQIVFKETYQPYPVRPYATGKVLGPADQMLGHGVVSAVSAIADEMTIMLRAVIDSANFTIDPQVKVPESMLGYYSQKDVRGAGRYLPYRGNDPDVLQEVHRDFSGLQVGMELVSNLYARAQRMVAAEGVNAMTAGKVRKAAEVEFQATVLQAKFGLMLYNLQRLVEDIFRIYMAMRRATLSTDHTVRVGDAAQPITREDFDAPYRIVPHADADNASSQARLERDMAVLKIVEESPTFQQRVAMGDVKPDWLLRTLILSHMGIQNPSSYMGPEPQDYDAEAFIRRIMPIVIQGAQSGDPVAQAIVQAAQSMQQQAAMGMQGGPQGMQGQEGRVTPGAGLNLPASPGNDSASQGAFAAQGAVSGNGAHGYA